MTKTRSQDRDRIAAEPAASVLPQGSFGVWLRTQREARGVGLREIADASKISVRYLEALEQDRFEVLPAPVFTRGFLREYARIVGLDPDEVVNLFLLASGDEDDEEESAEQRPARGGGSPSPLAYALLLVVAVALLLGLAALVSYWAKSRTPEIEEAPAVGERPAPAAIPPAAPAAIPPAAAPAGSGLEIGSAAVPVAGAEAPAADRQALTVQLDFIEDCWVELVVDGRRRTSELRTGGEVVTIEAEDSVLLTLGNPGGVRVEVNGRPFALPGGGDRVVRDLRIDRPSAARQDAAEPPT